MTDTSLSRLEQLVEIGRLLARERDVAALLERILIAAKDAAGADGGSLYLVDTERRQLSFAVALNDSLHLHLGGTSGYPVPFMAPDLVHIDGTPNHDAVITHCIHERATINVADAYHSKGHDFAGARAFDSEHGYRTQSVLTAPMFDDAGAVIGVLQIVNAGAKRGDVREFSAEEQRFVEALAAQAGIALEKQQLIERLERLFESLVRLINEAIDEKSPYTAGHCERVPELTMLLAEAAHRTTVGPLADFHMQDRDRRELRMAGLLHDCGKITTPVHVVDKATKLATIFDRIALIDARFAVLARDAQVAMLERLAAGTSREAAQRDYHAELAALAADREFLHTANRGSERMKDEDIARVRAIGRRQWRDVDGALRPLLDAEETDNLCIAYGTLTAAERTVINRHIVATIHMLETLPWPHDLANVPEYAGGHHERMDGKGYPRGLKREQMSWQARMMAIADIFEALTAGDRPYKPAKGLSESLAILGRMSQEGHVDPDLFDVFVRERVYLEYAQRFLAPHQIDAVDERQIPGYRPS